MYKRNSIQLFYFLAGLCFVAAIVAGCSEGSVKSDQSDNSDNGYKPCPNGPEVACTCADGQTGTHQCQNDVYTTCFCGAAGSEGATSGSSTSAVTTGTGGSAASSTGAGGAYASTKNRTGGSSAKTRQTAGAGGKAIKPTKITCPAPLTCETNELFDAYLDGGMTETVTFCATTDQGVFQMANSGPTPPMCKSDGNCKAIGLAVKCTAFDLGGLIFEGCVLTGCE